MTVVPLVDGFRLACNRDERRSRPAALGPRQHRLQPRTAVFPLDPRGGGTWIGANDAGLAIALLNRGGTTARDRRPAYSRGLIVPPLLELDSLGEVVRLSRTLDPAAFDPFRLVAVQDARVAVVTSDGVSIEQELFALELPLMVASSSLGDALVETTRRELFDEMVIGAGDSWLDGQFRFHRHRWPERPELSVCMQRADARTVSRSVIDVEPHCVRFRYEALDPLAGAA